MILCNKNQAAIIPYSQAAKLFKNPPTSFCRFQLVP